MTNFDTTNDTYDKSTLDAKFNIVNDRIVELMLKISLCVTIAKHNADIETSVLNALSTLPLHYVTYEELLMILKNYTAKSETELFVTKDDINNILKVDTTKIIVHDSEKIGLVLDNDLLKLEAEPAYNTPQISISINPAVIEYGQLYTPYPAQISVYTTHPENVRKLSVSGGSLHNEDITDSKKTLDTPSTTSSTRYTVTCINTKNIASTASASTTICRRVLFGDTEPTADTFFSYSGKHSLVTQNPQQITINQGSSKYGWIATPWKIRSFSDASLNGIVGGWMADSNMIPVPVNEFDSPYADGIKYYVYRTSEYGTGETTWNITNK